MTAAKNLTRFVEAQKGVYEAALAEIRSGKKTGHWMWYVFPQITGLGFSDTAKFFAIKDKAEATEYLNHSVLGQRLIEISEQLLKSDISDPLTIFGGVDSLKLKSSMTLFSLLENTDPVFQKVLDKFFNGEGDTPTVIVISTPG